MAVCTPRRSPQSGSLNDATTNAGAGTTRTRPSSRTVATIRSLIDQSNLNNTAMVTQSGYDNLSTILQTGTDSMATVMQYSHDNISSVTQSGSGHSATVTQGGM